MTTANTLDHTWDMPWLAAYTGDELPARQGRWEADPAGHDDEGNPQAVLNDRARRILLTGTTEGVAVRAWPYGLQTADAPGAPVARTLLPWRHISPATVAAAIARDHLTPPEEPGATPERRRLRQLLTMTALIAHLPERAQSTAAMLPGADVVAWRNGPHVEATARSTAPGRVLLEARAQLGSVVRALAAALPPQDVRPPFAVANAYTRLSAAFPVLTPYPNVPGTDTLAGLGTGRTVVNVHLAAGVSADDATEAALDVEGDLDLVLLVLGLL
ncbi:hypothetical protein ACWDRR_26130 [Kitasatospora sp. NPDC003701]